LGWFLKKKRMKTLIKRKWFAAAAALFCCALWGISTPIVKMGYA